MKKDHLPVWNKHSLWLCIFLMLLLCVTHPHPFSALTHLPNVTIPVMFVAAYYLQRWSVFALFMSLVALLDTFSVRWLGVQSHCITPAWLCMIPAYASCWLGGRLLLKNSTLSLRNALTVSFYAFVSFTFSFMFSNGGFYIYSGYFQPNMAGYLEQVQRYYLSYTLIPWGYVMVASGIHTCCHTFLRIRFSGNNTPTSVPCGSEHRQENVR